MRKTGVTVRKASKAILAAIPQVRVSYANGVIKTVTAGGATDGNAQLEVTVNGSDTLAPRLESYTTPAVGHLVRVQFVDGAPLIIGRVIGPPTF